MAFGFVYVLTNPSFEGQVKIGMTTGSVDERASQLSTTGIPYKFEVYNKVRVENPEQLEKEVHSYLHPYRVSADREFFKISPSKALAAIEKISGEINATKKEEFEYEKWEAEEKRRKAKASVYIEIKELIYKLDSSLVESFGAKNKDRNMKSILN